MRNKKLTMHNTLLVKIRSTYKRRPGKDFPRIFRQKTRKIQKTHTIVSLSSKVQEYIQRYCSVTKLRLFFLFHALGIPQIPV
jgi:hypothetical protein